MKDTLSGFVFGFLFIFAFPMLLTAQDSQTDEREPVVWKLSFEGNENYRGMVLKDIIATDDPSFLQKLLGRHGDYILNETEVRRDRIRIQRFYQRRGFVEVSVDYEIRTLKREWKKEVVFSINEGDPVMIRDSRILIDAGDEIAEEIRNDRDFERAVSRHQYRQGNRYQSLRSADVQGRFFKGSGKPGISLA